MKRIIFVHGIAVLKMRLILFISIMALIISNSCTNPAKETSFGGDLEFLNQYKKTLILKSPEQTIMHVHMTYHFEGDFDDLNTISKKVLNFDLNDIEI